MIILIKPDMRKVELKEEEFVNKIEDTLRELEEKKCIKIETTKSGQYVIEVTDIGHDIGLAANLGLLKSKNDN